MEIHGNARLLPSQRRLLCERVRLEGWTVAEAADAFAVSERTAYRWLARWDRGEPMTDRSSAPTRRPRRTPAVVEAEIERLRRLRWTATKIAATLGMPTSTVCAVLARIGLNRRWRLGPPEPANRYCRRHPGELIHIDIKKFGRFHTPGHRVTGRGFGRNTGAGWEFCHVAIDDTSRLAYVEILDDETGASCAAFLRRAVAWFAARGVTVHQVITDNGAGYVSKTHAAAVADLGLRHLRTRPHRPETNGKAERFIQTLQREWAYERSYPTSIERRRALLPWLRYYNEQRPHSALGHKTPVSQLHR
ncbi:MAG TPA: IS481 family transposase [Acidimicrobiales bacterium]|nr:IS481 family transposase [Acidimicrobiales bacterium]